jgi:hypothetical protein
MGKKKTPEKNPAAPIIQQAQTRYEESQKPTETESQFGGVSNQFQDAYNQALQRQTQDYGDIMGAYQGFRKGLGSPTQFSFDRVSAPRPAELGESYGYLREAMPGYRDFATTGGYSDKDVQELRARGISPIRAAYGNTMMELNRARAIGGNAGAPNYIAAVSRAQREMPGQIADATTNVNAGLADAIRQGRMFGLQGISGTGQTMGGLSSAEAGRQLQAALANQAAGLQAQGMTEQSKQNLMGMDLAGINAMSGLYGTTPGMASTFGNQALNAWQTRSGMEQARNQFGLGLLDAQLRGQNIGLGHRQLDQSKVPWWQTALGIGGTIAPFFSSKELKTDIKRVPRKDVSKFAKYLDELPLYTWRYKGDKTKHFGPIAEEFKKKFGVGDGVTMHPADIMGVVIAAGKEAVSNA